MMMTTMIESIFDDDDDEGKTIDVVAQFCLQCSNAVLSPPQYYMIQCTIRRQKLS